MQQALQQVETLLREHGRVYAANLTAIARQQFARDPAAACRAINTAEWWEGADAMVAIDLAVEGGFTPQARDDSTAYRRAMAAIYATMTSFGEINDTGALIIAQFHKWNESHV